jgi:hypothetical protein
VLRGADQRAIVFARELIDACERVVDRNRAENERPQQAVTRASVDVAVRRARPLEMKQGMLARLRRLLGAARDPPLLGFGQPVLGESDVIAFGLEHGTSLLEQRDTLLLHDLVRPVEAEGAEPHRGAGSGDRVPRRAGLGEDLDGPPVCRLEVRVRKLR